VEFVLDRDRHQLVPGRVEVDGVDAVPVAVVGLQPRRVLVCLRAERLQPLAAGQGPDRGDPLLVPIGALTPHGLDQHPVRSEDVVVDQRRRLVRHLVGTGSGTFDRGHRFRFCHEAGRSAKAR
jgi:hypothetical protein